MSNIILLAVCLSAGLLLSKSERFPAATSDVLNNFIIYISMPAMALLYIHSVKLDSSLILMAAMAWIVFGGAWLLFRPLGKWCNFDRQTTGALILLAGLCNTSFVGFPMVEAFFGKEHLGAAILTDQLGSFPAVSTVGVAVAACYSSGTITAREMVRRILAFPPFIALILAFLLRPVPFPDWLITVLERLGSTISPLALVSVGFQLRFTGLRENLKPLALGLTYKLLLGPALIWLVYVAILGARGTDILVTVFEAAMAPMITAGIIAIDRNINPQLACLMLGIGIPLSFLTLYGWHLFLTAW